MNKKNKNRKRMNEKRNKEKFTGQKKEWKSMKQIEKGWPKEDPTDEKE